MMDESGCGFEMTRTKLGTHANMPFVGKGAHGLEDNGRLASVSPYNPDYDPIELHIVNADLLYECKTTGEQFILVVKNDLLVDSM